MNNPGQYTLFTGPITTALDRATGAQTALDVDLSGMTALTLDFDFAYGSGGTTCAAIVQTSPDGGTKWRDIARADFLLASKVTQLNLEGLLSKGATAYADLAAEGVNDGILFAKLRVLLIVTGTYVNTTLAVNAGVR